MSAKLIWKNDSSYTVQYPGIYFGPVPPGYVSAKKNDNSAIRGRADIHKFYMAGLPNFDLRWIAVSNFERTPKW